MFIPIKGWGWKVRTFTFAKGKCVKEHWKVRTFFGKCVKEHWKVHTFTFAKGKCVKEHCKVRTFTFVKGKCVKGVKNILWTIS